MYRLPVYTQFWIEIIIILNNFENVVNNLYCLVL